MEIKDKIVSVEDLSALHEYNKTAYATKEEVNEAIQIAINDVIVAVY